MESRIRTGSGFRAQGAVKWKFPNGNPDVTDWFRSGEAALETSPENGLRTSQRLALMRTVQEQRRVELHISLPFRPPLPHLLSVSLHAIYVLLLRLESERVVRVGA